MEELVVEQVRGLAETPRLRESALAAARQELAAARSRAQAAESQDQSTNQDQEQCEGEQGAHQCDRSSRHEVVELVA